jgi:hypothetical protein
MLSCNQTTHLLSEAQDRQLDFRERLALKMHLLICQGCSNYRTQMDFLRQACDRLKVTNTDKEQP